jgi:predicted Zn-dependent protease
MHANNLDSRLKGYAWQFTLFDDPSVNAFCMPGGKVGVYSGIIPVAGDAGGVAVVIGHEIAHAIADHHNERAGRVLLAHLGGGVLSEALAKEPERTRQALLAAFGLGAQVGLDFPYSSRQEDEADRLGLIFMAMAGYDPQTAVGFWRRMAATEGGAPPEFIITHPSNETRINGIQKWLPDIKRKYFRK